MLSRRGEALSLQIEQQVRHVDATLTAQGHCEGNCTVSPGASSTGGSGYRLLCVKRHHQSMEDAVSPSLTHLLGCASGRAGLRDLELSSPLDLTVFTERITRVNFLKQHLLIAGRGGSYYFQGGFPFIANSSYSKQLGEEPVSGSKEKIPPKRVTAELNGFEHACLIRRNITDTQLKFFSQLVGVRIVLPHHFIKCSHIKNSDGEVVQWILSSMDEGEHRRIVGRIEERWNDVSKTATTRDRRRNLFIYLSGLSTL